MATFVKRRGRYRARVYHQGKQMSRTFDRLFDARQWASQMESDLKRGAYVLEGRHTVADMIDRYVRNDLPKKRAWCRPDWGQKLAWWRERIGRHLLAEVIQDPVLLQEAYDKLVREKKTPTTANRYTEPLSNAFSRAIRWRWCRENPVRHIDKRREPPHRDRYLTEEEKERLLQACRDSEQPWLYLIVVLAISTGARRGEILGLRRGDVDLKRRMVILRDTKNGETRSVPLEGRAHELMTAHLEVPRIDTDRIFPSIADPENPTLIWRSWNTARRRAKVEDFRFHDLRHTAASYLISMGCTLEEVGQILGHKNYQTTKRYAHMIQDRRQELVRKMNEKMFS